MNSVAEPSPRPGALLKKKADPVVLKMQKAAQKEAAKVEKLKKKEQAKRAKLYEKEISKARKELKKKGSASGDPYASNMSGNLRARLTEKLACFYSLTTNEYQKRVLWVNR